MNMKILLNNREESFDGDVLTVSEIMKVKNFHFKMLVVKLNDNLILKDSYDTQQVREGDDLKIIHLVSGG